MAFLMNKMNSLIQVLCIVCLMGLSSWSVAQNTSIDSTYLIQKTAELQKYRANDDYEAILAWKNLMQDTLRAYCCKTSEPYVYTMEWLGQINQEYGYYSAASQSFKEAVRYAREVYGSNHIDYALVLMRLANLYLEMGLY